MPPARNADQAIFGAVVRDRRRALGMTQETLSDVSGLHRNYIGGIERGERNPSLTQIIKLTAGLEWTPGRLFKEFDERI